MKDSKDKKEDTSSRFDNLFQKTADEIFYDFIKKYKKKILLLLLIFLISSISVSIVWFNRVRDEKIVSEKIYLLIEKKKNHKLTNKHINDVYKYAKNVNHKSALLILEDLDEYSKKEMMIFYKKVMSINYSCQYVYTTTHFNTFSALTEMLYLKTLYYLGKNGMIEEMKNFFMDKKCQASIYQYYMYYILAFFKCDYIIFEEMYKSNETMISNIDYSLLLFAKGKENKKNA